jgi:hypothetical protein
MRHPSESLLSVCANHCSSLLYSYAIALCGCGQYCQRFGGLFCLHLQSHNVLGKWVFMYIQSLVQQNLVVRNWFAVRTNRSVNREMSSKFSLLLSHQMKNTSPFTVPLGSEWEYNPLFPPPREFFTPKPTHPFKYQWLLYVPPALR